MVNLQEIAKTIKEKGRYWIAFTGDSITSCEWVHPNWREIVEYVLKKELNWDWGIKTFNFAYDGATSKDIVEKFSELIKVEPDMVLCMIGANDPVLGVSLEDHVKYLNKIKILTKDLGSRFYFSTCNKPNDLTATNRYLPYVEADRKLRLENFIDLFEKSDKFPKDEIYTFVCNWDDPNENIKKGDKDFWHPNQLGNAYIAKVVLKEIFNIKFNPDRYWKETLEGELNPNY